MLTHLDGRGLKCKTMQASYSCSTCRMVPSLISLLILNFFKSKYLMLKLYWYFCFPQDCLVDLNVLLHIICSASLCIRFVVLFLLIYHAWIWFEILHTVKFMLLFFRRGSIVFLFIAFWSMQLSGELKSQKDTFVPWRTNVKARGCRAFTPRVKYLKSPE